MPSSPSSSAGLDRHMVSRPTSSSRGRIPYPSFPSSASRPPVNPKWRTSDQDEPSASTSMSASSSSRSGSRIHPYNLPTAAPTRNPSPPPSISLSTGQPVGNSELKTQAAFVGKLYAMLEDEDIAKTDLIHWSPDGTIFTCPNPTEFAK